LNDSTSEINILCPIIPGHTIGSDYTSVALLNAVLFLLVDFETDLDFAFLDVNYFVELLELADDDRLRKFLIGFQICEKLHHKITE
jgi:hypothetical protein